MVKKTKTSQQISTQQPPHPRILIKGKGYVQPFLAGAGGFEFEIKEYTLASVSWVFCKSKIWYELYIQFENN